MFKSKHLILTIAAIFVFLAGIAQPPEEFFKGLDLLNVDENQAWTQFRIACSKDTAFHGSYHFLGVLSLRKGKIDSAIYYFKKSIGLNSDNVNHTREMTVVRLIGAYLNKMDFEQAYNSAREARVKYPDNRVILQQLKDVCLWSFHIRHNGLDSSYLSPQLKEEYEVNSVDQEYLILRRIRVNDSPLAMQSQKLIKIKKNSYDVLTCMNSQNEGPYEVKFRISWDMNKYYGGKITDTKNVVSNKAYPVYERIGAMLVSDANTDIDGVM